MIDEAPETATGPGAFAGRASTWTRQALDAVAAALVTAESEPPAAMRFLRVVTLPSRGAVEVPLAVLVDLVFALVLFAMTASLLQPVNTAAGTPYSGEFTLLLAALCSAPVLVRSRWPLGAWRAATLALLLAAVPLQTLLGDAITPGGAAMYALCLYTVATRSDRRTTIGVWTVSVVAVVVAHTLVDAGRAATIPLSAAAIGIPLLWGQSVRERRQARTEIAEQRRRTEEERAARAVLEERSRIARELHDVVAHHMSVIAVQAEAAPLRSPDAPEEVRDDLASIRTTALQAMTEMRRVLGVLRQDEDAESEPQPGLDHVPELLANARTAGLDVELTSNLEGVQVPSGVGVSLYRILQESLSNALRHAPGAAVSVDIRAADAPPRVEVRIENAAPTAPPLPRRDDGGGHGLVGMRERAAMLGGELTAGPTPGGGFAVAATLPLDEP